jgi:hypothetical protein
MDKYGFRFYNITREMLYWPPDQTITDRICGKGQLFLGQENFIAKIKHLIRGKERLKEITREQYMQ